MTTVVISQPMFFPWVGLFEQIKAADVFVHYDDVAFSKGSFTNRVQIKTPQGSAWLTVPLRKFELGRPINAVEIDDSQAWRQSHLQRLKECYQSAPFCETMLELVQEVYARPCHDIGSLGVASLEAITAYLELDAGRKFVWASSLGVSGKSSTRVLDTVRRLAGTVYVTGHGARNYLDHAGFEEQGVEVRYLDYTLREYPQLHGPFTPYVSILDLIANVGPAAREWVCSPSVPWREFLHPVAA